MRIHNHMNYYTMKLSTTTFQDVPVLYTPSIKLNNVGVMGNTSRINVANDSKIDDSVGNTD
jgi:hypothetical protein